MATIKRRITQERYEELMNKPKAEQREDVEATIPREWYMGRGYYGYYISEDDDGQPCICFQVGDSCD